MIDARCGNLGAKFDCRDRHVPGALPILMPTLKIAPNRQLPNPRL